MSTPINIIIDNKTVLNDVEACEIQQAEGQYCHSVSLSMKSKKFWTLCDPTTNFGTLRIKVVVGDTTYQFLTEERDTSPTKSGVAFTVWGRSKQALLSKPYSKTINDTDDTSHPWQTGNTTASAIVAYVIANYCDYSVTVTWNAGDFAVYVGTFSVSNQSPVDVISALANVIGAELVADADGSLTIEAYSVSEDASVESYNDLDDIVQLSETIDYPSGFNAVTVYGYGSGSGEGAGGGINATISAERQDEGDIYPGREHTVRVYYYHSKGDTPAYSFPEGSCQLTGSGVESITEDVQLIFGQGNTSKTNTAGKTEVAGDTTIPITTVSTTYSVNYRDYAVRGDEIETYNILFYFTDKSAYTVYSFTVVDAPGTDDEDPDDGSSIYCAGLVLEKASPTNVAVGDQVYLWLYNPQSITVTGWANSGNTGVVFGGAGSHRTIVEDVLFTNGEAELSYPVYLNPSIQFKTGAQHAVTHTRGLKTLTVNAFIDVFRFYYVYATVTYTTQYDKYWLIVPSSYAMATFNVIAQMGSGCALQTVSFSTDVAGSDTRDITINITDYATEVALESAAIYVDGAWKGTTDSSGNIILNDIAVGDHTLRITKDGYLPSDLDDLANDTFTVTAE